MKYLIILTFFLSCASRKSFRQSEDLVRASLDINKYERVETSNYIVYVDKNHFQENGEKFMTHEYNFVTNEDGGIIAQSKHQSSSQERSIASQTNNLKKQFLVNESKVKTNIYSGKAKLIE